METIVTGRFIYVTGWMVAVLLSPISFTSGVLAQTIEKLPSVEPLSTSIDASKLPPSERSNPLTGLQFQDTEGLNQGKIVSVTKIFSGYVSTQGIGGYCAGNQYQPPAYRYEYASSSYTTVGQTTASFISAKTPPSPGLRVVIRNVTTEVNQNPSPYTDREYDQGDRSEFFIVRQNLAHDSQYLAVVKGTNKFQYDIKKNGETIESGTFSAIVGLDHQVETRYSDSRPTPGFSHQSSYSDHKKCEPLKLPEVKFDPGKFDLPKMPDIPLPTIQLKPADIKKLEADLNRKK